MFVGASYHDLYMKSKGNVFKNKRVLMDYIHKVISRVVLQIIHTQVVDGICVVTQAKAEKTRAKTLTDQMEARRTKNQAARSRRADRLAEKRHAIIEVEKEEAKE